jgi:hypothetical protein
VGGRHLHQQRQHRQRDEEPAAVGSCGGPSSLCPNNSRPVPLNAVAAGGYRPLLTFRFHHHHHPYCPMSYIRCPDGVLPPWHNPFRLSVSTTYPPPPPPLPTAAAPAAPVVGIPQRGAMPNEELDWKTPLKSRRNNQNNHHGNDEP